MNEQEHINNKLFWTKKSSTEIKKVSQLDSMIAEI